MKLQFANSAIVKAPERMVFRGGAWRKTLHLPVRYGVLEHPGFGPVLMDTGYSNHIFTGSHRSIGLRAYAAAFGPELLPEGDVEAVLAHLGYAPRDVKKIIVTHFHADHVSALRSFPAADIIAHRATLMAILKRSGFANQRQGVFPELLPDDLAERTIDIADLPVFQAPLNLGAGRDVLGDGSVIAVDLPGHAEGHFGLCFPWLDPVLLYACDVQWVLDALTDPGALPLLARIVCNDLRATRRSNQAVAGFRDAGGVVMLCHDPGVTPFDIGQRGSA